MRLHIYQDYWAANWAESGTDNLGEVQLIDARGHLDTAHRALYALAAATVEHGDDAGWYAGEVVLCLSPSQRREVGDLRARIWSGRWGTQHARDVAARLHRLGIRVRVAGATARELAWMREWAGRVAVEGLTIGRGGVATLAAM